MTELVIIAHDIRSSHNIGAILRTSEGFGVSHVYISGFSPYPTVVDDSRLPHIHTKLTRQISKTALGAEKSQAWSHAESIETLLKDLRKQNFAIVALEQSAGSIKLPAFAPSKKVALLLGREVEGIDQQLLQHCDQIVEIPMFGHKESFNVVEAATAAMYHCTFFPFQP